MRHLLLIGAYRDNEVEPTHRLSLALERITRAGARLEQIALRPLAFDALLRLVADAIRVEPPQAAPLAAAVHERTGGNPLFAFQLLGLLAEERLLWFDAPGRAWHWDASAIGARGYADNVVDLMLAKLQRLPVAVAGGTLQETRLPGQRRGSFRAGRRPRKFRGRGSRGIPGTLKQAGLVMLLQGAYLFAHDRVREAAYALIPHASGRNAPPHRTPALHRQGTESPAEHVFALSPSESWPST